MSWWSGLAKSVVTEAAGAAAGAFAGAGANRVFGGGSYGSGGGFVQQYGTPNPASNAQNKAPSRSFNSSKSMFGQTKQAQSSIKRGDNIIFPTGDDPVKLMQDWDKAFKDRKDG